MWYIWERTNVCVCVWERERKTHQYLCLYFYEWKIPNKNHRLQCLWLYVTNIVEISISRFVSPLSVIHTILSRSLSLSRLITHLCALYLCHTKYIFFCFCLFSSLVVASLFCSDIAFSHLRSILHHKKAIGSFEIYAPVYLYTKSKKTNWPQTSFVKE